MSMLMTPPAEQPVVPRQILLRRAAGYLELGALLVDPETGPAPSAARLLKRALSELAALPADVRKGGMASLIEGEALRSLGQWESALTPLHRATEADRHGIEAWLGLGWCLKRLGRLPEAVQSLEAGLDASPREPVLHYNLACYHSLVGNVASAIDHLRRAIAIDDRFRDLTGTERDFDPIRSDPRFQAATHLIA